MLEMAPPIEPRHPAHKQPRVKKTEQPDAQISSVLCELANLDSEARTPTGKQKQPAHSSANATSSSFNLPDLRCADETLSPLLLSGLSPLKGTQCDSAPDEHFVYLTPHIRIAKFNLDGKNARDDGPNKPQDTELPSYTSTPTPSEQSDVFDEAVLDWLLAPFKVPDLGDLLPELDRQGFES
ncbi:hypothetical protein [Paraburkholderia hayleyella]|uniref:hypothetical protein n=1 Tax=Paraburkholderia hayleyella TaxID=2152889 RepID=UPI001292ACFA|nr:hypothetical protein [Paraburkholderia hayleyella]